VLTLALGMVVLLAAPVAVLAINDYRDVTARLDAAAESERHVLDADRWLHLSGTLAGESALTSAYLLTSREADLAEFMNMDFETGMSSARADTDEWLSRAALSHSMVEMVDIDSLNSDPGLTDAERMSMDDNEALVGAMAEDLASIRRRIDAGEIGHNDAVLGLFALADLAGSVAEGHINELISHASEVNAGGQLASEARTALAATILSVRTSEALATWGAVGFPSERPTLPQVSALSHSILLLEDGIEDLESTLVSGQDFVEVWETARSSLGLEQVQGVLNTTRGLLLQSVIDERSFPDPSEITPVVVSKLREFDDPFGDFIALERGLYEVSLEATKAVELTNEALAADAQSQRNRVLGLLILLVFAALVVIVAMAAFVVRPLRRVSASMDAAAGGDLSSQVPIGGTREVRAVASSFNQALGVLSEVEQKAVALADGDVDADIWKSQTPGRLGAAVDAAVARLAENLALRDDFHRRLAFESAHDPLTNLPNRRAAFERLRSALARAERQGSHIALLQIDLDGFRAINDVNGQRAGDNALRRVAQLLVDAVRDGDLVARVGADEFLVVAEPVSGIAEARSCLERILEALRVEDVPAVEAMPVVPGVCIGLALGEQGLDAEELFRRTELALERAKQVGPGTGVICDDELVRASGQRVELDAAIVSGLANGEFELHYQPVVDADTGRLVSLEALIRWNRPGHGMVPPGGFIPHAEWSDLIIEIDRWVLRTAAEQARTWDSDPVLGNVPIAVNFSGRHMASGRLAAHVLAALSEAQLESSRLIVELTESVLLDDLDVAAREWGRLRAAGVRVALDDFGTGFMSLAVLRTLSPDTLKIDRSFITNLDDQRERSLLQLLVSTGHLLGAVIVGEGVETPEQHAALAGLGVERVQGFWFARPMPADAVERFVRDGAMSLPST
jgi:diguanylate cyclase (GGDEF)-like protein